jgi:23S rRNA pseudouridine1911/1915/1917 synthase
MIRAFPRQALHAFELRLVHPDERKTMSFNAPLPEDLEALLAGLDRYVK